MLGLSSAIVSKVVVCGRATFMIETEKLGKMRDVRRAMPGRRWMSWSLVRVVGEMQILTRASYTMVIVVPLLAGLWPLVGAAISRYYDILACGRQTTLQECAALQQAVVLTPLPDVWVLSFIASLCALLAHTAYQTAAPEFVRKASEQEYVSQILEQEMKASAGKEKDQASVTMLLKDACKEYVDAANSRALVCLLSFVMYAVSLCIVVWIITDQTMKVLKAAAWL